MTLVSLDSQYARLQSRERDLGKRFERPLTQVERSVWNASTEMARDGYRGFAFVCNGCSLSGPLDVALFRRAIEALYARHDVLRTRYVSESDGPRAIVEPSVTPSIRVVDWGSDDEADTAVEQDRRMGFDLREAPLHRFLLGSFGSNRYRLYHFAHHIVVDGVSQTILFRELANLYAAELRREPLPPVPSGLSYTDVAEWTFSDSEEGTRVEHAAFWQVRARDRALPSPIAASGRTPSVAPPYRRALLSLEFGVEFGRALAAFRSSTERSVPSILLAALTAMLHAEGAGGSPIGYMSANRHRKTIRIVGLFSSVLPLCVPSRGDLSFDAVLREAERELAEGLAHQALPPVLHSNVPEPSLRIVLCHYGEGSGALLEVEGLTVRSLPFVLQPDARALFDLWLNTGSMNDGRLWLSVQYNADLIDAPMLRGYLARLEALLLAALHSPHLTLDDLASISREAAA